MPKKSATPFVLSEALLSAFDTNDRINQYLLENLPAEAWRAEPPEKKGRDVAGIVAHMHNVRVMWLKATKGMVREQLDRFTVTPAQAKKALDASRAALREFCKRPWRPMAESKAFAPMSRASLAISLRTTPIIADRSQCSPASLDTRSRKRRCSACGSGAYVKIKDQKINSG
jgi:DinB family